MTHRMIGIALMAAVLGLLAACGDDGTSPNTAANVTVRVVDPAGAPVEGLDLMVVMDSQYYQDAKSADKAMTSIQFIVPIRTQVVATIEDVAGGHIRTLLADTVEAGVHQVYWNGSDDQDVPQHSGLYRVRVAAGPDPAAPDTVMVQPMYMALIDFEQETLGTTDAEGEIVLTDKRLFPALYGPVTMNAYDENATAVGLFPVTSTMRFYLRRTGTGLSSMIKRDVLAGNATVDLVWNAVAPAAAVPAREPAPPAAAKDLGFPSPTSYALSPPFPNPFN